MIRNPYFLKYIVGLRPQLILHIGGHQGQDGLTYKHLVKSESQIIWAEPNPSNATIIRKRFPQQKVIEKLFWSQSDQEILFYETRESEKSSAIKPTLELMKSVVSASSYVTTTIDKELHGDLKEVLLVLDVQGGELEVLSGAHQTLDKTKWVILEIATSGIEYEKVPDENEIDAYMRQKGFAKSIYRESHNGHYKDQLYMKVSKFYLYLVTLLDSLFVEIRQMIHLFRNQHKPTSTWHCEVCSTRKNSRRRLVID